MKTVWNAVKKLLIFGVILLLWYLGSRWHWWSAYVLPSPGKVFHTLLDMMASGELAEHLLISLRRVAIGFGISCALTFVFTLVAVIMPRVVPLYTRLMGVIRHIPPISLIPLLILWFGIGETPKLIVIVLASFFPILLNTETGIFGCDEKLVEVGKVLNFSKGKIFFRIQLPNAVPNILVGIRIGLGYGWRAIVGAEMIAATSGVGYLILDAQALSRTDKVIGGILVIGVIGLLTDALCGWVVHRAVSWESRGGANG